MFKVYQELPVGYQKFISIDMKENKKEFILINVLSIVAFIPFFFGLSLIEAEFTIEPIGFLIFIIVYVGIIILHEIVHAIFFKIKNNVKVKFKFHGFAASASVPEHYYQKSHYMMISLAPLIILNSLLVLLLLFTTGGVFYLIYFILASHFSGCVGDLYVFFKLLRAPKDILIEDYGVGMRFFKKVSNH